MKKLGLLFGLLAMASFIFAQVATVNQINLPGTSSVTATVTQMGANTATVNQTNEVGAVGGNLIDAYVEQYQTGVDANMVEVSQSVLDDEENAVTLTTYAYQFGENNTIMQTQAADGHRNDFVARYFNATQYGMSNQAYQTSTDSDQGVVTFNAYQDGNYNIAHQLTNNEGGWAIGNINQYQNGNYAIQTFESIWANGDITQDGMTNSALQHFYNNTNQNYASIWQMGSYNDAVQIFTGGNTAVSNLYLEQYGDGSYSNQLVVSGNNNNGWVFQQNYYGYATLLDGNRTYQTFYGESNYGSVSQNYGLYNMATQLFYGDNDQGFIESWNYEYNGANQTFAGNSMFNYASIYQYGNGYTTADQYLEGSYNMAYITQDNYGWYGQATQNIWGATSSNNTLTIWQHYGNHNTATQNVTGSTNTAYIDQGGEWGPGNTGIQTIVGDDNLTEITQVGSGSYTHGNFAQQLVTGDFNTAKAMQTGDFANAYFNTLGNYNTAALVQNGDGSFADVYQFGDGNILQGVGGEYGENSNGSFLDLDQLGDGHLLNLMQTSFGGAATVGQSGVGNVATIIQN